MHTHGISPLTHTLCMYTHFRTCVHISAHVYTFPHMYIYTFPHMYTHFRTCIHISAHVYTFPHICTYFRTYVHISAHMYTFPHICTHFRTCVHISAHMYVLCSSNKCSLLILNGALTKFCVYGSHGNHCVDVC